MGVAHTDEWLREIGKHTGKEREIEALIKEEHEKWLPKLKAIKHEFDFKGNGEKVEVLGALGQGRLLAQVPYFDELGLKSSAAMCQDFDNLILKDLEKLISQMWDFDILVNTFQAAEQTHITNQRNPDIAMTCPFQGDAFKRDKGVTRVHALRSDTHPWSAQSGYTGAIAFGNFLLQSLKSHSYQRTMKEKTQSTYKDWWYKQPDSLYYLKAEE